ncbi:MAG: PD-(D/E)XK nuclease family protein [Eubacterium sp.]|nr:PD-(D/E)XK nuclease family protein [Eubacterium sp.]
MLNLYIGRESVDKESFIYHRIREARGKTLVLVPDQYTLAAERQALSRLGERVLLDVEITSLSRLGASVLKDAGTPARTFIDKYGRHMLVTRLLAELEEELTVFKGAARKETFAREINDFLSKAKQYGLTPEGVAGLAPEEGDPLLTGKLEDLSRIFAAYEAALAGKYTDAEDLLSLYAEAILHSAFIAERTVWLYGFDSFTPKNVALVQALIRQAREVNVFLTGDDRCRDEELFELTRVVARTLEDAAAEAGIESKTIRITPEDAPDAAVTRPAAIRTLEKELYAVGTRPDADTTGLTLVRSAGIYNEAESAASFVLHLLRDEGMRLRDIVLICNDQTERASVIKRVFEEYGLALFDDRKRSIADSPIAIYAVAMIETLAGGFRTGDLLRVLKTGLTGIPWADIEALENYAAKYRIKGSMWRSPFKKGAFEYGEEGLAAIEAVRVQVMQLFDSFGEIYRGSATNGEFTRRYADFLCGPAGLTDRIEELVTAQTEAGLTDLAEETAQIWSSLLRVFEQLTELMGEEKFRGRAYANVLTAGLLEMEVGVLPPTADDILLGTMQRSRTGDIRALLILGANEGILPLSDEEDVLFSPEELAEIEDADHLFGSTGRLRAMEEDLAIYRNLSKPSDHLWISWSTAGSEGEELRPSRIVDRINKIFTGLEIQPDVLNREDITGLLGGSVNTLRHYTEALRRARRGEAIDARWQAVGDWLAGSDEAALARVREGLAFDNTQDPLPQDLVHTLYSRSGDDRFSFSPSRLEKFSRCPFAHFVSYGLKPEEQRLFEISGRELGDLYHEVLMRISARLTAEDRWDTITREECDRLVEEVLLQTADHYRDGLFSYTGSELYWRHRAYEACTSVCWTLVEQTRAGAIRESRFEEPFGRGRDLPPICKTFPQGTVYIEGKIDRMDILADDRVKIIDYKTGQESMDRKEAASGYRIQLMLYLKAAQAEVRRPAGVFYFLISDPQIDADDFSPEVLAEKVSAELRSKFRMKGIMVGDPEIVEEIAGSFDDKSDIIPVQMGRNGVYSKTKDFLLTEEEFAELQEVVDRSVTGLCERLLEGRLDIRPKKSGDKVPCTYCQYHGICRFDLAFGGCGYEKVK